MNFVLKMLSTTLILIGMIFSQQSINVSPKSFELDLSRENIPIEIMSIVDVDQLLREDAEPGIKPFRYGFKHDVDFNTSNAGSWEIMDNGDSIWRLKIRSTGAYAIRLFFSNLDLPEGALLHIYREVQGEYFGGYSSENNDIVFSTPLVEGDDCIIEYFEPAGTSYHGNININHVIHDYKDFYNLVSENRDECGTNVVCPEADPYPDEINASAHLDLGWSMCSGAMINNTDQDLTAYFLTADHCVEGSSPSNYRFYFNYATTSCNGSWASMGSSAYGSQLQWTTNGFNGNDIVSGNDVALLKISGTIQDSWDVYYAGWNINSSSMQSASVCVHHPSGDPKQISFTTGTAYTSNFNSTPWGTHWKVYWEEGGTEGGSSGSPLFDNNGRIIGPLTGGPDYPCGSSEDYGLFGKLNYYWDDIQPFLDPGNTGVQYLNGTYNSVVAGCTDSSALNYDADATQDDGSCEYSTAGEAQLSFGNVNGNVVEITLINSVPVSGYQFVLTDSPDVLTLIEANGGTTEDNDFMVSTSENGTILAFSMVAGSIPAGDAILTNLTLMGSEEAELCISEGIVSSEDGDPLYVTYGECFSYSGGLAGDLNGDFTVDILDIVIEINIILGQIDPTDAQISAADINSDGVVNIQDIILTINIIMG